VLTGVNGDKSDCIVENKDKESKINNDSINNSCMDCPKSSDHRIVHNRPSRSNLYTLYLSLSISLCYKTTNADL